MTRTRSYSMAAAALFLAACADDPIQPDQQFTPQLSQAATEEVTTHLVDYNGRGKAVRELAANVAALGGSVLYVNHDLGFALVAGLSADGATALASASGVSGVYDDPAIQLDAQAMVGETEMLATESISSVANPAGAFRHNYQWNMRAIGAPQAWAAGRLGSPSVSVAILDTGIDYDNYDMVGMVDLDRSANFVPSDDAFRDAFWPGRHSIDDFNGHGSNVANHVASNGTIFAGVTSRTRLIGVKVLGRTGSGSLGGVLAGLAHAADVGADVANMSLGVRGGRSKVAGGEILGLTNRVFNYAHRQGMVVVVSAGNDTTNMDDDVAIFRAYCEAPHVVCVSATGPTASTNPFSGPWTNVDALAPYSNYGMNEITVAAPGGSGQGYASSVCARHRAQASGNTFTFPCNAPPGFFTTTGYAGTSQAAPHVAGLAALLVEQYGPNNPSRVVQALKRGADDLGAPGRDAIYGDGRINVPATLGL